MFRFLQAFYWTFFCRQAKSKIERRKNNPYRELPEGWDNQRDVSDPLPVYPEYKVSDGFRLKEDHLAYIDVEHGIQAITPGKRPLEQYWLLAGSMLTITYIHSPMFVCVLHIITDRSHGRYQDRYTRHLPIPEGYTHEFAPDRESFIVTFDELARMKHLND